MPLCRWLFAEASLTYFPIVDMACIYFTAEVYLQYFHCGEIWPYLAFILGEYPGDMWNLDDYVDPWSKNKILRNLWWVEATCRLYRKSPKDYDKILYCSAGDTRLSFALGKTIPEFGCWWHSMKKAYGFSFKDLFDRTSVPIKMFLSLWIMHDVSWKLEKSNFLPKGPLSQFDIDQRFLARYKLVSETFVNIDSFFRGSKIGGIFHSLCVTVIIDIREIRKT
jgi:hypothetical protein